MSPERLSSGTEVKKTSAVSADVVVFGATAVGVMAAVAARREGASVALVGPDKHIGGMVSGGLGWTDVGETNVIKGLTREFYQGVADHYGKNIWEVKGPEPHVAEKLLVKHLEQARVAVSLGENLQRVSTKDNRIQSLRTEKAVYQAGMFIDASYEGDVMAGAGVSYAVGRESKHLYGEEWAGKQPAYRPSKHNFDVILSPFAGDGNLLPHIREPKRTNRGWPMEDFGEGDGGLQAYAFRVSLTNRKKNMLPFPKPDGYDPEEFSVLSRYIHAKGKDVQANELLGLVPDLLPNNKCDVNSIGPFSLNVLDGSNRAYPDGDTPTRQRIKDHHLRFTQGFLYYLANENDVPSHIRKEMKRWGLCADEFIDTAGWPHQLYIRDGRRMKGEYVLTEHDLRDGKKHTDTIAQGAYNIDIREVERTWRYLPEYFKKPAVFNEGYLSVEVPIYEIPYRSITPRREENENLLVPVCSSTSHVAFSSVRMEPTMMQMGEAAGVAAAQAARRDISVQNVNLTVIR